MKISDDDLTAAEEGFRVLSCRGQSPLTVLGPNVFKIKILQINALRIGIVSDLFELDDLVGEDHESWGIISTGDFNHDKKVTQYAPKLNIGDIVTVNLNRKDGTLSFKVNETEYSVAY